MELTATDKNGVTQLENVVNGLRPAGATRSDYGMKHAKDIINASKAADTDDQRGRVVIMFTDGNPTDHQNFNVTVANGAISAAKDIKSVAAKVYTIGVFGEDPDDRINKYMNRVSSNCPNAFDMREGGAGADADENAGYYSTAASADDLSRIFSSISSNISEATNKALDGKTEVNDVVSDYFDLATNDVNSIKVYTADRTADGGWADKQLVTDPSVTVALSGKTIKVSGYNYAANYITDEAKSDGTYGQKLIIEIKVKPSGEGCATAKIPTNEGNATVTLDNKEIDKATPPTVNGYSVEYVIDKDDKGASWPNSSPKKLYYPQGAAVPVTDSEPTRDGYEFIGWNTKEDGTGTTYKANGTLTITGNTTLYAQWKVKEYSFTVNYLWDNKSIPNIPSTTGSKPFGTKVTVTTTDIDGYTLIPGQEKSIEIGAGENVLNLNYRKNLTLTANSDTKTYDGTEHTVNDYTSAPDKGVTFGSVTASGTGTDAGEYDVKFVGESVVGTYNDLYIVTAANSGTLTINKRSVTLTSETASKPYDGTPLTKPEVTVTGDGFVEGEVTDIRAIGSVTNVSEGKVTNTITFTKGKKFKDSNYTITEELGKLTITEASAPTPATFDFNDVDHSDDKATPAITKTVKGNVGKNFTEAFYVTVKGVDRESAATMSAATISAATMSAAASYTGTAEVTYPNLKDIAFQFNENDKLTFRKEGKYIYTVREIPGQTSRMSYDTTEYTLTINVVLDADSNTYQVKSWQFTPGNRENLTQLNIVNTYRTYHPSTPSKPTLNTGDHYAYVMGYPDGTVRPNGSITRAEVSAILFRLLSDKTRDEYFTTESSFTDVKAGAWYNNSIATLEKAGVIVDTAKGGAFRPNEAITRAELAAMLAQFSDAKPVKGVKFSDVSAEHWAYEAIAIAAKMGWIEGYPDGTFRPDATITRAEMMTLVNRALERVPSDEDHLLSKRVMLTFPDCKSGDWFYIAVQEATNSHTYERAATEKNGDEQWTALRANRDWTLLEK